MKFTGTFLFITIATVSVSSIIAAPTQGEENTFCERSSDCEYPLLCLKGRCKINYCATPIFHIEHATCIPIPDGFYTECENGYKLVSDGCEPIDSSKSGVKGHKCATPTDCLSSLTCIDNRCKDACELYDLEPHEYCETVFHKANFTCHHGYTATGYVDPTCRRMPPDGCEIDDDCHSTQYCDIYGDCADPCATFPTKFVNGDCVVVNHTLNIACHSGYERQSGSLECEKIGGDK